MSDVKRIPGSGSGDWSRLLEPASGEEQLERVLAPRGTGVCHIHTDLGEDPLKAVADWKAARGEKRIAREVQSEVLRQSVQEALIASKKEVREVISAGRRGRSRNRMNQRTQAMVGQQQDSANWTMADFWQAQNRADDDRRYRSSLDEPTRDPDKEH